MNGTSHVSRARSQQATLSTVALATILWAVPLAAAAAVHAGDQLTVTVYEHPELSGPVTVDTTEHISLPLAGTVSVAGLEPRQIAARLQSSLATYILKPGVTVELKSQQLVLFVSGGPGGTLVYQPGENLLGALGDLAPKVLDIPQPDGSLKGGDLSDIERSRLDLRRVGIVRDGTPLGTFDAVQLAAAGRGGPLLQPGDTLSLIDKPNQIRIDGDVRRPGFAYLSDDEPLRDALDQAGGITTTAATANIQLRRDGSTQLVALGDTTFNAPGKTGDSITVPSAPRINVVGLVTTPGAVALKTDTSLLSALYQAGGPTKWADLTKVQVMEHGTSTPYDVTRLVHGDTSQNPSLKDGDVVFVPEGHKVDYSGFFQTMINAVSIFRI